MTRPDRGVVVVTGGSGGIGRVVCRRLADEGHDVVAVDTVSHDPPDGVTVARLTAQVQQMRP